MRVRPYGQEATIIDGLGTGTAAALRQVVIDACASHGVSWVDVVPAATSIVVTHEAKVGDAMRRVLCGLDEHAASAARDAGQIGRAHV